MSAIKQFKPIGRIASASGMIDGHDAFAANKPTPLKVHPKPVLITGGCGFIGTNLAHRLLSAGQSVIVYDNLSRRGVDRNLQWLSQMHGKLLIAETADVLDAPRLRKAVDRCSSAFHFAAQVAVTTSLVDPIHDFEVNARGTLNLLEALRAQETPPPLVFTSTNKVYGGLPDVTLTRNGERYEPQDLSLRGTGIGENRHLDFHSPYGCSKGTADQYVLDYARTFNMPAVAFRMSCIYGPHQCGNEDQGWVAHFLIKAINREPITLYGDGMQVRDILFVEDLVDAFLTARAHMPQISGQAFNIGGGVNNTVSLLELLDAIESMNGRRPDVRFGPWRPGDQRYYVSDTAKMKKLTGWSPRVSVASGLSQLHQWLTENVATPSTLTGEQVNDHAVVHAAS
ncbi:MAG TPA: NAD-dependent epimerase/dehydratase family protein [Tepidisphaeraceae bacterium]|jgi:CDP-paratose 2-epimerase